MDDFVLGLDQAAVVVPGCDVAEREIAGEDAEERDSLSDENRDAGDGEVLDEARAQETLDGDAAVDVEVPGSTGGELGDDLGGRAGHLLDRFFWDVGHGGEIKGRAAEDDDALRAVGPGRCEAEDGFEGLAADDERVDLGHELFKAVGYAAAELEEVEATIWPRDESIYAGSDKDRGFHSANLVLVVGWWQSLFDCLSEELTLVVMRLRFALGYLAIDQSLRPFHPSEQARRGPRTSGVAPAFGRVEGTSLPYFFTARLKPCP